MTEPQMDRITQIIVHKIITQNMIREKLLPNIHTFIMTTRFNNKTALENHLYREKKWNKGCVYTTLYPVNPMIPYNSRMIVIEMNNETNQIIGFGLLFNKPEYNRCVIYEEDRYQGWSYIGKYRISREELTEDEDAFLLMLEKICFTGKKHLKRGQGIAMFPLKFIWNLMPFVNIIHILETMFENRFSSKKKIGI